MQLSSLLLSMTREYAYGIVAMRKKKGEWQYLIVLHQKGHWAFPKGHPQMGEPPLKTAKREFAEETGMQVKNLLDDSPIQEQYVFTRDKEEVVKNVTYWTAEATGELEVQLEEIAEAKWLNFKEAGKKLTFPSSYHVLVTAHSFTL